VAELLGLLVKKGKDFTRNVDACVAAYDDLREAQRQLLRDEGVAHRVAALKARYDSRVSDEKALDFLLWSVGKERGIGAGIGVAVAR
jgi:alpha-ketoglutarate-dependent taurine dioxygenase